LWMCAHWERLAGELDLWEHRQAPSYGTLWNLLAHLEGDELARALRGDVEKEAEMSVDGKTLRGSKRAGIAALQVIAAAGHRQREVLGQRGVEGGDLITAALALLSELPLEGKLVSLDAQLMQRKVVKTIVEKGGPISGSSKGTMESSERLSWLG